LGGKVARTVRTARIWSGRILGQGRLGRSEVRAWRSGVRGGGAAEKG